MRILHIMHRSVPGTHGYSIRSREIVTKQLANGMEPIVVTSPSQAPMGSLDSERSEYIDGVRYFRSCSKVLPSTKEVQDDSPVKSLLRVFQNVLMLGTALRVAGSYRPQVIHAHSPFTCGIVADVVGRVEKIPTLYEIRGIWEQSHASRHNVSGQSLRYRAVRFLEGVAIRRADLCCVIGEALKREVLSRGIEPDRIMVVPNGVDATTFAPGPPDAQLLEKLGLQDKIVMGYIGSFSSYERLDTLIRVMIELVPDSPELRLMLVGDGDLMPVLTRMVVEAGISKHVIFTGRVPHLEIPNFYRLCNFLVLPRQDPGKTQLVTPLKPLEIMAMGKPLIASDIEGHREVVKHGANGILFKAGDVTDLVSKCRELVTNKKWRMDLGDQAREWVKTNRDWNVIIKRYVNIYERLTGENISDNANARSNE